jgi:putative glycosyltransferase
MDLSIVTTLFQSAPHLKEFYSRISKAAEEITEDFEIIFVHDGSQDNSLEIALNLFEKDERIKIIDLSRNFGHHKAMMTGLAHASGELVFLLDGDLEIAPERLKDFYKEFKASKVDVVYGVLEKRREGLFNRIFSSLFYFMFKILTDTSLPKNLATMRLMSRRYVKALVSHRERELLIAGLWVITGFEQKPLTVQKEFKGRSTYNLRRKASIIVNAVTSFSNKPLVYIFYIGCIISLFSAPTLLYIVIRKLFFGTFMAGWPSLIASIWFLGGIIIMSLGVVGIYLSKIFSETKQRPYTIIREIYTHKGN